MPGNVIHNGEPLSLSYRYRMSPAEARCGSIWMTTPIPTTETCASWHAGEPRKHRRSAQLAGRHAQHHWFGAGLLDGVYQIYAGITSAADSHTRYAWLSQPVFDGGGNLEPLTKRWSTTRTTTVDQRPQLVSGGAPTAVDRIALKGPGANVTSSSNLTSIASLHVLNAAASRSVPGGNKLVSTTLLSIRRHIAARPERHRPAARLHGLIASGGLQTSINIARAGGAWTGNGLTSSTARTTPCTTRPWARWKQADFKSIYGPAALFDGQPIGHLCGAREVHVLRRRGLQTVKSTSTTTCEPTTASTITTPAGLTAISTAMGQ
jgi:hypothetical protein